MAKQKHIQAAVQVALYDIGKKKLIGVFTTMALANKWVYGPGTYKSGIFYAWKNKYRIKKSIRNFFIAVRTASAEQLKLLEDKECWIHKDYPQLHDREIQGFTSTAETLKKEASHRILKKIKNPIC